jgi:Leucine-rich repeat (LRR) protein
MKTYPSRFRMSQPRGKNHALRRSYVLLGLAAFSVVLLLRHSFSRFSAESSPKSRCTILSHSSIHEIESLIELDLSNCNLTHLPVTIRYATNLLKLDLSNNPLLHTLPSELQFCTKLDILFVSNCPGIRDSLPHVLGKMTSITRLGWKSGSLRNLDDPELIPPNLVHLILTHNKIQSIDNIQVFKRLNKVRKLMVSHNPLKVLNGKGLAQLHQLENYCDSGEIQTFL